MAGTFIYLTGLGGGTTGGGGGGSAYWGDAVANAAALPAGAVIGEVRLTLDTLTLHEWNGATWTEITIRRLASTTDNTVVRFDGTSGAIQGTGVVVDDVNNVTIPGQVVAGSTSGFSAGVSLQLDGTAALLMNRLTTVQRDSLSAINGMIIYNTDDNLFQGYANGAWVNLHGWGA